MFDGRFVTRPSAILGAVLPSDTTRVGAASAGDVSPFVTVGPGVDLLVRYGTLHAGVDGRALFVSARVAAPIGALYGLFGVEW